MSRGATDKFTTEHNCSMQTKVGTQCHYGGEVHTGKSLTLEGINMTSVQPSYTDSVGAGGRGAYEY